MKAMKLRILGMDGKTLLIDATHSDTISYLMQKVEQRTGISPENQILLSYGKRLEIDKTLS